MINKKGSMGFVSGVVSLIGGMVFIWLLITLYLGGSLTTLFSSKYFVMLIIFLVVLLLIRGKK